MFPPWAPAYIWNTSPIGLRLEPKEAVHPGRHYWPSCTYIGVLPSSCTRTVADCLSRSMLLLVAWGGLPVLVAARGSSVPVAAGSSNRSYLARSLVASATGRPCLGCCPSRARRPRWGRRRQGPPCRAGCSIPRAAWRRRQRDAEECLGGRARGRRWDWVRGGHFVGSGIEARGIAGWGRGRTNPRGERRPYRYSITLGT